MVNCVKLRTLGMPLVIYHRADDTISHGHHGDDNGLAVTSCRTAPSDDDVTGILSGNNERGGEHVPGAELKRSMKN